MTVHNVFIEKIQHNFPVTPYYLELRGGGGVVGWGEGGGGELLCHLIQLSGKVRKRTFRHVCPHYENTPIQIYRKLHLQTEHFQIKN